MELPSPGFIKALMGLDYSPREFDREGERIDGLIPITIMVTKLQDRSP